MGSCVSLDSNKTNKSSSTLSIKNNQCYNTNSNSINRINQKNVNITTIYPLSYSKQQQQYNNCIDSNKEHRHNNTTLPQYNISDDDITCHSSDIDLHNRHVSFDYNNSMYNSNNKNYSVDDEIILIQLKAELRQQLYNTPTTTNRQGISYSHSNNIQQQNISA